MRKNKQNQNLCSYAEQREGGNSTNTMLSERNNTRNSLQIILYHWRGVFSRESEDWKVGGILFRQSLKRKHYRKSCSMKPVSNVRR